MPELPEVQTIVSDLKPLLVGNVFAAINGSVNNHIVGALDNA